MERLNANIVVPRAAVVADIVTFGFFPARLLRRPVAHQRAHRFEIEDALEFRSSAQ